MQMQKRNKTYKLMVFVLCGAIIGGAALFARLDSRPVLFNCIKAIPILGWIVEYNFPPVDYYAPLCQFHLLEGSTNVSFVCRYHGRYDVQIANVKNKSMQESGVSVKIEILDSCGRKLFSGEILNSRVLTCGRTDEVEYRYQYSAFRVPDEIPIGERLFAVITVGGDVARFLRQHPDTLLQVKKCFDK